MARFSILVLGLLIGATAVVREVKGQTKTNLYVNKIDLEASDGYFNSGLTKYKLRDYVDALADFENAITYNSKNWRAYRGKGDVLYRFDRYVEAISNYSQALSMNKNDTLSYKRRAESRRMAGFYKESVEDYDHSLKLDTRDADMYFGRASSYYKLGEYQKSIDDYGFVIKRYPSEAISYLKRSLPYISKSNYSAARQDLEKYLELGGKAEGAYYYLGLSSVYLSDNDPSKADTAIYYLSLYSNSSNEANRNDPSVYQLLGMAYGQKRDSARARQNFQKSISLDVENTETYFQWGNAEINFGNYKKANELYTKTYSNIKKPSADFYNRYALVKTGIGDTAKAVEYYSKALILDSNKREVYENRIVLLFNSNGYYKIVLNDLDNLIRLEKDDKEKAEWHSAKSMIDIRVGDFVLAREEVDTAIDLMSIEPMHYMVRALVNSISKEKEEIIMKDIDKAIQIDPTMIDAYLFKATFYALHGDQRNGCETLKFAIKIGASVNKDIENYVCKGKMPKNGKIPDLFIPFNPRLIIESNNSR